MAQTFTIDADFPGGNILVDRVDGQHVYLQQDLRDTTEWWFYWCFRVRGAQGQTLTFHFLNGNVFGCRGPAKSVDHGETWTWLGKKSFTEESFSHTFAESESDVRFSFAMPYQRKRLDAFLARHKASRNLDVEPHAKTRKGRQNIRLHAGCLTGTPKHRVLLTCRHHCCEMMAEYSLEGILETVLGNSETGVWLATHVEFLIVPMVDLDGVEDGDQGKLRAPRDHNRDYDDSPIYPSVRATMDYVPPWTQGILRMALDLHCPWIRGNRNECLYQVGQSEPKIWAEQQRFGAILEACAKGPIPYKRADDLPFGCEWNTGGSYKQGRTFSGWAVTLPGVQLAGTMEIPYATARGHEMNQESAKLLGIDLATAIKRYVQEASDDKE